MNILAFQVDEVCLKTGQELFEIIEEQTHTQIDRHIHADENNTCTKT